MSSESGTLPVSCFPERGTLSLAFLVLDKFLPESFGCQNFGLEHGGKAVAF